MLNLYGLLSTAWQRSLDTGGKSADDELVCKTVNVFNIFPITQTN